MEKIKELAAGLIAVREGRLSEEARRKHCQEAIDYLMAQLPQKGEAKSMYDYYKSPGIKALIDFTNKRRVEIITVSHVQGLWFLIYKKQN